MTIACPMPRPRAAASRAGAQMQGFQLTCALPGQSCLLNQTENVAYHVYRAEHERPPRRHDITIRVAKEAGRHADPAAFAAAAGHAAAGRDASILSAHTAEEIICVVTVAAVTVSQRSPWRWPSWPTRSAPGIRSCHPAGKRAVPAVVRGLVERRLPQRSWQAVQVIIACPMPRPRAAASRAGPQMQGFQLTCALPGHSW